MPSILPNTIIYPHKNFEAKRLNSSEKIIVDYFFELNNQQYIVEYNGIQHYQPIRFGKSTKKRVRKFLHINKKEISS